MSTQERRTAVEVQLLMAHYRRTVIYPILEQLNQVLMKPVLPSVWTLVLQAQYRKAIGPVRTTNPIAEYLVTTYPLPPMRTHDD